MSTSCVQGLGLAARADCLHPGSLTHLLRDLELSHCLFLHLQNEDDSSRSLHREK